MLFIIILIILVIAFVFASTKLGNLKYRAKQQVLKNTGLSSSNLNAGFSEALEKKHLEKFLMDNPNYTEESIKELIKQYAEQLLQKNANNLFSETVCQKMQDDKKIDKLQSMQVTRVNINYYKDGKFGAMVIYTDNRDEYNLFLNFAGAGEGMQLEKYQISKGAVVGF